MACVVVKGEKLFYMFKTPIASIAVAVVGVIVALASASTYHPLDATSHTTVGGKPVSWGAFGMVFFT